MERGSPEQRRSCVYTRVHRPDLAFAHRNLVAAKTLDGFVSAAQLALDVADKAGRTAKARDLHHSTQPHICTQRCSAPPLFRATQALADLRCGSRANVKPWVLISSPIHPAHRSCILRRDQMHTWAGRPI